MVFNWMFGKHLVEISSNSEIDELESVRKFLELTWNDPKATNSIPVNSYTTAKVTKPTRFGISCFCPSISLRASAGVKSSPFSSFTRRSALHI